MSHTRSRTSSSGTGLPNAGKSPDAARRGQPSSGRSRRRFLGRGRKSVAAGTGPGGWACPNCGLPAQDKDAARLGFCAQCHDFTGMCSAGRKIVCPDMMTLTSWHTPCTSLGVAAWQIYEGSTVWIVLLCADHDNEVRAGHASWIREAVPLADLEDA